MPSGDIEHQLSLINQGLKAQKAGVTIQQRKDSLVLVATLPAKTPDRKPHQQRIPTGQKADSRGLRLAHTQANRLAGEKAAGTFSWADWIEDETTKSSAFQPSTPTTVAAWIGVFEQQFWQGKVRTAAAERTWDRIQTELKRLPPAATLTTTLLAATAAQTPAGSRTRLESCKVLKRLAVVAGLGDLEKIDSHRTTYEPQPRDLPSDDLVVELLERVRSHGKYGWLTAALVVYGCRPAEVFSLKPAEDGTGRCLTVKRKNKAPTWRTCLALEPGWVEQFDLFDVSKPWDVTTPATYDSEVARKLVQSWGKWLRAQAPGMQLYDLRHAWAVRSIRRGLNTSLCARCMGHSIQVHSATYHAHMQQSDVAAVAAALAG